MSLLDKVGKVAMDAIDKASRVAGGVQQRADSLIERSALASQLRDKIAPKREDDGFEVPTPEQNASPFARPLEDDEPAAPLADAEQPGQVFGPGTDPWTGRSLQLLSDHGVEHTFVDLEAEGGMAIETRLVSETAQHNPPYIYLRGEFIGGFDALNEIVRLGQIEELTKSAEERANATKGRTRIVVAKRGADETRPGAIGSPTDRK
jgi:glutaredoxin